MSSAAKRELDSPSQDSASKRRRQNDVHDNDEETDIVRSYNPKNLLKSDSSFLTNQSSSDASSSATTTSAYQRKRINLHLLIPPIDLDDPLGGVERQLDDVLLTYLVECRGILMGWRDIHFLRPTGRVLEESPFSPAHISVDTVLWRPRRGERVQGSIKFMGPSHIGLLVLGTFNASIPLPNIPPDWHFQESFTLNQGDDDGSSDGSWVDGNGEKLVIDQLLLFTTVNVKKGANILSVEGSLLLNNDHTQPDETLIKRENQQPSSSQVVDDVEPSKDENVVDDTTSASAQRKADKEKRKAEKKLLKEKRKSKS